MPEEHERARRAPAAPDAHDTPDAMTDAAPASAEAQAEATVVDAAAGHQKDKPAVAGEPRLEPDPERDPPTAAEADSP